MRITPEYITSLKENEIFVFGSNLTGTFIYLAGYIVWLWTWQALLVCF